MRQKTPPPRSDRCSTECQPQQHPDPHDIRLSQTGKKPKLVRFIIPSAQVQVEARWGTGETTPFERRCRKWGIVGAGILVALAWKIGSIVTTHIRLTETGIKSEETINAEIEIEAVKEVTRRFVEAKNSQERIRWVSNPEGIKEAFNKYYEIRSVAPIEIKTFHTTVPVDHAGRKDYIADLEDVDGEHHYFCLVLTAEGYRVDWESAMAVGEMDWGDFCTRHPTDAVQMRAYLAWSHHYGGKSSNLVDYQCFYLSHPFSSSGVYAYVHRDTPVWEEVTKSTNPAMKTPVNLLLKFDPDPELEGAAVIVDFLHKFWISPAE